MSTPYVIPTERFARCIAASKRLRWDVETDVIRGRRFDREKKFLPDGLTLAGRLDFLSQELNRESNTLCAKSNDVELTNIGLELKTVVEQFREQVQNLE